MHLDLDLFPTDMHAVGKTLALSHNSIDVMLALLLLSLRQVSLPSLSFREARGALATWPLFGRGSPPQSMGGGERREQRTRALCPLL